MAKLFCTCSFTGPSQKAQERHRAGLMISVWKIFPAQRGKAELRPLRTSEKSWVMAH